MRKSWSHMRMRRIKRFVDMLAVVASTGVALAPFVASARMLHLEWPDGNGALPVATVGQRVTAVVSNASPASVDWRVRIVGHETFGGLFEIPEFQCALQPGSVRRIELPPAPAKAVQWHSVPKCALECGFPAACLHK